MTIKQIKKKEKNGLNEITVDYTCECTKHVLKSEQYMHSQFSV
jgi:hypothetical protein